MQLSLVAITWEDVISLTRFSLSQDFAARRLFKLSVGFVVYETDEYLVLADDFDLSLDPDSPNNYGTLVPKHCIRERSEISTFEVAHGVMTPATEQTPAPPAQTAHNGRTLDRFFTENPTIVASAREVALRLRMAAQEAETQLEMLVRRQAVERRPHPTGAAVAPTAGRKSLRARPDGRRRPSARRRRRA